MGVRFLRFHLVAVWLLFIFESLQERQQSSLVLLLTQKAFHTCTTPVVGQLPITLGPVQER